MLIFNNIIYFSCLFVKYRFSEQSFSPRTIDFRKIVLFLIHLIDVSILPCLIIFTQMDVIFSRKPWCDSGWNLKG